MPKQSDFGPPEIGDADIDLRLPVHCSTVHADDLRVRLVMAAGRGEDILVEAGDTQSIGQAVLQLLIAARTEATETGQTFALMNLDPELAGRLRRLGLAQALGLPAKEETAS